MNEYLSEPGVILVNRYAELKEEAGGIHEEMEKVKGALIDYAQREGGDGDEGEQPQGQGQI